ncbi:VOC family protein [Pseudonocardia sp. CA-107938]|uniref:VOC family protein n=1 Tax=Pseudonocardia sp. CA-107938 TaxID=3240021 RepID=UPI003D8D6812
MTSPFDELREPIVPVDPDPAFAAALRARLEREVLAPASETPVTTTETRPASTVRPHTLTPYLRVRDTAAAIDFYVAAFDGVLRGEPFPREDGRIAHAEITIGDSVLMLADSNPDIDILSPAERGGPTGSVRIEVPDPDAAFAAAVAAGASVERPVQDEPYGRGGVVLDDSGNRLMIVQAVPALGAGDLTYASLWVRDVERATRFFGAVLGWAFAADHDGAGVQVTNLPGHLGIWSTTGTPTLFCCYAVEDAEAAVAVVRAAGGTAQDVAPTPYGPLAQCVDDQGVPFAVNQAVGGPVPGQASGALGYVELRVPDVARARAFYGSTLGVQYLPGTDPGYWHPFRAGAPLRPMAGLAAGPEAAVVPLFVVDDLDAALTAVTAAGGRVDEVSERGHDPIASCVDDQGFAFGLYPA